MSRKRMTTKKKIVLLAGAAAMVGGAAFAMTGTGNAGQLQGNQSSRCNVLNTLVRCVAQSGLVRPGAPRLDPQAGGALNRRPVANRLPSRGPIPPASHSCSVDEGASNCGFPLPSPTSNLCLVNRAPEAREQLPPSRCFI